MKRKEFARRVLAASMAVLILCLSCTACGGNAKATTMHLRRTEGRVSISDDAGKDVEAAKNLALYSGYEVKTRSESYAWIDLDEVKLAKLDQSSLVELEKDGAELKLRLRSGNLFFHVSRPLEEEESMTIRTSSVVVGIRGTCGWVVKDGDISRVYILEGTVRCRAGESSVNVSAGEMGELTQGGQIDVRPFTLEEVPAFVLDEVEDDDDLLQAVAEASGSGNGPGGADAPGASAAGEETGAPSEWLEQWRDTMLPARVSYERMLVGRDGEALDPPEARGLLNCIWLDVNGDGKAELVSVIAETNKRIEFSALSDNLSWNCSFTADYGYDNNEYPTGDCRIDVMVYFDQEMDGWCAAVCRVVEVPGGRALQASLLVLANAVVGPARTWSWDEGSDQQGRLERVKTSMEESGWPFLETSFLSIRDETSMETYVLLSRMEVEEVAGFGGATQRYLHIVHPDELSLLP